MLGVFSGIACNVKALAIVAGFKAPSAGQNRSPIINKKYKLKSNVENSNVSRDKSRAMHKS
jgi:hypothetical protein